MDSLTENYQLKWHSFGSYLHSSVAAALTGETFADVALFTTDGHQIMGHRFVLSACSQYLHQILKCHYKITTTLPILIILPPEINYKTLKILVQYMYSGEATVSKDVLENVLRGGDLLKVKGLWRPREEEYHDKKLVKLHQKFENNSSSKTNNHKHHNPAEVKKQTNNKDSRNNQEPISVLKLAQNKGNSTNESKTSESESVSEVTSNDRKNDEERNEENVQQFLVIKEEPIEWSEVTENDMELVEESDVFDGEMTIKPEVLLEDDSEPVDSIYSPLTCELCSETFTLPADWVKHIQTHTDMMPAKRQRRGRPSMDEDNSSFPPLHCDMCQKFFPTPAEWVHHIQNTHTEFELRLSNKTSPVRTPVKANKPSGPTPKICTICNKKFPSHASMIIHKRTHTGEKPYMCEFCYKGFNVKSNLLRHLRTLHDRIINSTEVESKEDNVEVQCT